MFFSCINRAPAAEGSGSHTASRGSRSLTVDIHCHRESAAAGDLMRDEAARTGHAALQFGNEQTQAVNAGQLIDIKPKMASLDERLADMDRMGVDIQAISA